MKTFYLILIFAINVFAFEFWPLEKDNIWLYETDYDSTYMYYRENIEISFGPIFPPIPGMFIIEDSIYNGSVKFFYHLDKSTIFRDNTPIVDFSCQSIKCISDDSIVAINSLTFENCLVLSDSTIYAPNVGPIRFRFGFHRDSTMIAFSAGGRKAYDFVYAKVNGLEYGKLPDDLPYPIYIPTKVVKEQSEPSSFHLFQNYPNPFNGITAINFELQKASDVRLSVFDLTGRQIKELLNSTYAPGQHKISWNGTDSNGLQISSGVYLIKLEAEGNTEIIKAVYTR